GERFCKSGYLGKNSLGRFEDLLVGETQDEITESTKIGLTILVMGNLRSELVNAAVQLHDELERVAIEIGHIGPDRCQPRPRSGERRSLRLPEGCSLFVFLPPLPLGEEGWGGEGFGGHTPDKSQTLRERKQR